MLQEIKYRLFEIFLTQKKKLVLFACLIFVGLFVVSQTTHAFVLDLANVQLDALDFIDNTVLKYLVFIALLAIESVTFLNISAGLLDWASSIPVGLSTIGESPNLLVNAGWNFTSGLANLTFILIFVVIALSYILRLDNFGFNNFEIKKTLPRLIIIALLVNFSLLFVKMFADIGWIFQNSFSSVFFPGGEGLATTAAKALTDSTTSLLPVIIGVPVAYMVVAWIPYVNVAALTAIGALVLATGGGALLGVISQTIMVIVFNFIVGFIFLSFAALFLVRIAFIWLLAIFAPLAFVASILPNTKKYFDNWLKALVQWILLGVVVFFLMGLGLMLFGLVAPGSGQEISFKGEVGNWKFFDTFYKYIFLVIYMIVVFTFSKKVVPIGSQMIMGGVGKLVTRSQKFAAGQSRKRGMGLAARWEKGRKETAERVAAKMETRGKPTLGERVRMGAWFRKPEQALNIGLRAEAKEKGLREKILTEEKAKILSKAPKEAEDRRGYLRAELLKEEAKGITRSLDKIAAIMDILTKEGKIGKDQEKFIADAVKRGVDPDKILERRPDLAPKLGKTIAEIMDKMAPEDARKKIQKEAYQNDEVVFHILKDEPKFSDIERNGKAEIKKEIIDTLNASYQHLITSRPGDVKMLNDRIDKISRSPKWPK